MTTHKLSTGIENGLPVIRLISFYSRVGHGINFSKNTAAWKRVDT